MFGPFTIKEKRSELKRYGALFTCMSSRAVHIEVTYLLDADSIIKALRRFIARRGNIRSIWSDNGSNFIGAERELWKSFLETNHEKVNDFLLTKGTDLIILDKNPSSSSNFVRVCERQICSARAILTSLIKNHGRSLDTESLGTLMPECEAILNSRPLTVQTMSDVNSPTPLVPANILTMKSKVILPPAGSFDRPDLFSKKRWRRVQHIANEFWTRWKKEFLTQLQVRSKWNEKRRNFKVGDIVLLKEDCQRNKWPVAKVKEVFQDSNGFVRSVKLMVNRSHEQNTINTLDQPINKIVLLVERNDSPTKETIHV